MHDISAFTLCSDTKFQVEYFDGEFIINFILNPDGSNGRLVEIEVRFYQCIIVISGRSNLVPCHHSLSSSLLDAERSSCNL